MNSVTGFSAMLTGWTTIWHMQLLWLLPLLVAAVAIVELTISIAGLFLPLQNARSRAPRANSAVASDGVAKGRYLAAPRLPATPMLIGDRTAPGMAIGGVSMSLAKTVDRDFAADGGWRITLPK